MSDPLTDDLIARLEQHAMELSHGGYDVVGELLQEAAEALAAASRPQEQRIETARRGQIAERFQSYISTARNARREYEKGAAARESVERESYLDYAHGESVKEQILLQAHATLDYDLFERFPASAPPAEPPSWQPMRVAGVVYPSPPASAPAAPAPPPERCPDCGTTTNKHFAPCSVILNAAFAAAPEPEKP